MKQPKTIWLEAWQLEALQALSERTRVPMAVYLRDAIELVLQKYAEDLKVAGSTEG